MTTFLIVVGLWIAGTVVWLNTHLVETAFVCVLSLLLIIGLARTL